MVHNWWILRGVFILSALDVVSNAIQLPRNAPIVIPLVRPLKFHRPTPQYHTFPALSNMFDHFKNRAQRYLTSSSDPAIVQGCTLSGFSVNLTTSGVNQLVQVDTGSSTLAVAGTGCANCGVSPLYTPSPSATNTHLPVSSYYLDQSGWAGTVFIDNVTLSPMVPVNMAFASITSQSGDFFTTAICNGGYVQRNALQGIIGFAYDAYLENNTDLYFEKLVNQTGMPNVFAIQMCRTTGRLWLGGFNSSFFSGSLQYTPVTDESAYNVNMTDLLVNGNSLGFGQADFPEPIVDSGTSLFLLPKPVYNAVVAQVTTDEFLNEFGTDFWTSGNCYAPASGANSSVLNAKFPTLTVKLAGGVTLTMNAISSYIFELKTNEFDIPYLYCPGLQEGAQGDPVILGWSVMNQFTVVFDRANRRVGFAPTLYCNAQWEGTWTACTPQPCGSSPQITSLEPNMTCVDYQTGDPLPSEYCLTAPEDLLCPSPASCSPKFETWKIVVIVVVCSVAILGVCLACLYMRNKSSGSNVQGSEMNTVGTQ